MKGYFLCFHDGPEWWYCQGLLENGFCFGEHVCSHPGFAPGDLLMHRKDRLAALRLIFPEADPTTFELVQVKTKDDLPDWYKATEKTQDALKPMYAEYARLLSPQTESTKP